jgi:hypothetical protein
VLKHSTALLLSPFKSKVLFELYCHETAYCTVILHESQGGRIKMSNHMKNARRIYAVLNYISWVVVGDAKRFWNFGSVSGSLIQKQYEGYNAEAFSPCLSFSKAVAADRAEIPKSRCSRIGDQH